MNSMKFNIVILCAFLLAACMETGPQKTLNEMAQAMETNDGPAFLAHINMPVFAENYIRSMTRNDEALNSINTLGKLFGLGSLDELIGSVVDMQSRLIDEYNSGISTGKLRLVCERAETPDCPWVPAALREAQIVELSPEAAIAKITTPIKITSWLALHKNGDKWQVVGQAALESTASAYALSRLDASQGK